MTNEELIYYIQRMPMVFGIYGDLNLDCVNQIVDRIKSQEQENSKLKAKIKRLNGKSEMYRDMADSFCNSNIKLKAEIEQLKESRGYLSDVNESLVRINDKQDREITKLIDELEQLKEIADMNNPCYQCVRYDQCGYQHSRCNSFESLKGQV